MENKGIRAIWYSWAVAFLWLNAFTDIPYIFVALASCCISIGNIRSRQLWKINRNLYLGKQNLIHWK